MTREARMMSGIILITVPTIQYGGWGGTPQFIALGSPNRSATGCDSDFVGILFLHAFANRYRSRGAVSLIYAGAVVLALAVVTLGVGLLRSPRAN
ncbi:MAG TPA: hypothetical protein VKD23_18080 [Terriglobales bacterium]|nr:hypothetical protein [Terriglobales bacterium]